MLVTGTTAIVGIIGNPIVQVKSPGAMNRYFADNALNTVLVPMEIAPDAIPGFIAMMRRWTNCKGIIVTVPYKQVVALLLDDLTPRAARFSTVNVFRRDADGTLTGEMFDGVGFVAAAARHGTASTRLGSGRRSSARAGWHAPSPIPCARRASRSWPCRT